MAGPEAINRVKLRGLTNRAKYQVTSLNQRPGRDRIMGAAELAGDGLEVKVPDEWMAKGDGLPGKEYEDQLQYGSDIPYPSTKIIAVMKISAIETIHLSRGNTVHVGPIQWLWVRVHTDEGIVGLGETYPSVIAEKAVVHRLAPLLIDRNPLEIDRLWADMFQAVSYAGWAGAEMRAISAIDIALWDLAGKTAGMPIYQLLGGASRDSIRIYNTCYDHIDFLREPVRLAESLMASGVQAMKIWPFDPLAKQTGGQFITAAQMREGLGPLEKIRERLGDSMDVAMEFHGYWNLPSCHPDRPSPGASAADVARRDAAAGQPGCLRGVERGHQPPALRERASDDVVGAFAN